MRYSLGKTDAKIVRALMYNYSGESKVDTYNRIITLCQKAIDTIEAEELEEFGRWLDGEDV